jgi:transcriptional regulator with PAS, ATPase and Fis domain
MSGNYLLTGDSGPMAAADLSQRIADALCDLGIETVRLSDLEHAAIRIALENAGGNRTRAARTLGISVRTLQRKLKRGELGENASP